ncbi:MAG: 3-deoxy-8-phosphooctulonate synthase [Verrucomicrobiae bacterium]|nr:3-deoxy-8-phosphooctulonate synthase [Verrucomicrobiae bacterium]
MPANSSAHPGGVQPGDPMPLIAGPCAIESADLCLRIAEALLAPASDAGFRLIFKASYDKANRSSPTAFRGPGIDEGLAILTRVRSELGVPVTTDVHSIAEVGAAAQVADVLQIPAFLCRQTDLVQAAARTGKTVNVKKGQFLAPWDAPQIAAKLREAGCEDFFITERGTTFGYNNLVVDMRAFVWMRELGLRVIFDATHSVQRPGGLGDRSGGDSRIAPVLARAAIAAGIDGLFIETHPDPESAPSDGPNMVPLADMPALLRTLARVRDAARAD